jgi:hypothetical protein
MPPKGFDDLNREHQIILTIHAAIPDLVTDRHVIQAGNGCLMT